MMRGLVAVIALAACSNPPPLTIDYALASQQQVCTAAQGGTATSCSDVALPCDTYLLLDIVDPNAPAPENLEHQVFQPVTGRRDLCSIAGIDLGTGIELPDKTLQVQIAIYTTGELATDDQGNVQPPTPPTYSDDSGFPEADSQPVPVIGGSAFYHPGDTKTVVTLGCMDPLGLAECAGTNEVAVTASAIDFDTDLAVSSTLADNLVLSVGEPTPPPHPMQDEYALSPGNTVALDRNASSQVPSWGADVSLKFQHYECVELLDESSPPITPVLTCQPAVANATTVDFTAIRISESTLTEVLAAATPVGGVPANGITVGVVLDYTGQPVMNATVTSSDPMAPPPQYLSADRTTLAGSATSVNGIFVAFTPFGSSLTAHAASAMLPTSTSSVMAGDVDGKVTAVVLQFPMMMGN